MMDISHVMRGPIVGREGLPNEVDLSRSDEDAAAFDDEKAKTYLKRKLDEEEYIYSKKRRKQLKPIRIATNLEDMVKVPKQIIGLNNDLDNMTHAVPKETSSKLGEISPNFNDDVHLLRSRFQLNDSSNSEDKSKPEINVPNAETGPNFNPNFLFPFSFQPMKNSHFWSEASLKIFNQEAYCELCKKEFCNKYFLKTHKANKHGIYVDFPPGSSGKGKSENGRSDSDCERAFCELCNKRFCNKYFVRRHKTKSHGLPDEENQYGLDPDRKRSSESEGETDNQKREQEGPLNLIVKEEEEKEDDCSSENIEKLQTMLLRLNPSEVEGKLCKSCHELPNGDRKCACDRREPYLSEVNDSSNESKNEFGKGESSQDFLYLGRVDHLKQMKPTSSYCEICNKELCNKYFMRTHMQRMHGIEIEHGTQIGGVVCNICNKELCSKYFLRVHKQNTHGIVSPNAVVGPSTSSGNPTGVREGKRGFLPNFSQVCYICNKRFRSPKWLQAHFASDHREEMKEVAESESEEESVLKIPKKNSPEAMDVISKLFWENNTAAKSYNCSQCPFSTSVLAFLFVHERSHYVLSQDSSDPGKASISLQSLIQDHWQQKISQQISECLDLSAKHLPSEQNGS